MKVSISFDVDHTDPKVVWSWLEKATLIMRTSRYLSNWRINVDE